MNPVVTIETGPPEKSWGILPSQGTPHERPHVLVVDDENGPRQALRMLLKENHTVHLASNAIEALQILGSEPIEVTITDVRMPGMSGVELLEAIRQTHPDLQVIILTGFGQLDTAMRAVEHGAYAYTEKPFDNDALLNMVSGAMARYRSEHERRTYEYLALEANRFETLGRVISGMMHDMGSPLTVLGTHLELMEQGCEDEGQLKRLKTMQAQVGHCSDMVRSTMGLVRQDTGSNTVLRLNNVVHSCIDVASPFIRENQVEVHLELSKSLPLIEGDLVLLRQAILNLITNACQAMEKIEGVRELRVRTWKEGGFACLSVQDTGPGVPVHLREKIFEPFFTTKGRSGTGLGMAVVSNVMRRLEGAVHLMSGGEGAMFVLQFPAREGATDLIRKH